MKLTKVICNESIENIQNGENPREFLLKSSLLFSIMLEALARAARPVKDQRGKIGKEELQLSVYR